ncbi:MAG TPA: FGGY family carbohydrate kinase [Bacilli bacterium]|nr:FGGY family carbohydrate kinase [Bacilli bacterium]
MKYYLAIDIGASSGRHIVGWKDEQNHLHTQEVYRFSNGINRTDGHLVWDIEHIFSEVKEGIKAALVLFPTIDSMAIDSWGVDYVLLSNDEKISPVYAYRDSRTKEAVDLVHSILPFSSLYGITGTQFQPFNTIYQLYTDKITGRSERATDYLMIPEYLNFRLTGHKLHEYTNASTTGLLDIKTKRFSTDVIDKLNLNKRFFERSLYKPGTVVGNFLKEVQDEIGGNILVKLCASHDTGAAVEGIDMTTINAPYISSGTWSLLGIKMEKGITSLKAMKANYTNEYGPDYIRFQKNIMGLWIIQELAKDINKSFSEMVIMAQSSPYQELFDVNDPVFLATTGMKKEIMDWFYHHNRPLPSSDSDIINATYRSLAKSYQTAMQELEAITNEVYDCLYIVGGGAKNQYLNKLTEEFTKKKVIARPLECAAIGNIYNQMEKDK